ncbi:hypothetical protein BST81_13080 [Leptolyngbya sp. 'hensonii']|nr:hypothetical protein BST81_13080 [Leptolyngbya sp. 'hensonii']
MLPLEEPLGLKNPLLPPPPLGSGFLQPKFLVPLGARPLSGFNFSTFFPQGLSGYRPLGNLFEDFPFAEESRPTEISLPENRDTGDGEFRADAAPAVAMPAAAPPALPAPQAKLSSPGNAPIVPPVFDRIDQPALPPDILPPRPASTGEAVVPEALLADPSTTAQPSGAAPLQPAQDRDPDTSSPSLEKQPEVAATGAMDLAADVSPAPAAVQPALDAIAAETPPIVQAAPAPDSDTLVNSGTENPVSPLADRSMSPPLEPVQSAPSWPQGTSFSPSPPIEAVQQPEGSESTQPEMDPIPTTSTQDLGAVRATESIQPAAEPVSPPIAPRSPDIPPEAPLATGPFQASIPGPETPGTTAVSQPPAAETLAIASQSPPQGFPGTDNPSAQLAPEVPAIASQSPPQGFPGTDNPSAQLATKSLDSEGLPSPAPAEMSGAAAPLGVRSEPVSSPASEPVSLPQPIQAKDAGLVTPATTETPTQPAAPEPVPPTEAKPPASGTAPQPQQTLGGWFKQLFSRQPRSPESSPIVQPKADRPAQRQSAAAPPPTVADHLPADPGTAESGIQRLAESPEPEVRSEIERPAIRLDSPEFLAEPSFPEGNEPTAPSTPDFPTVVPSFAEAIEPEIPTDANVTPPIQSAAETIASVTPTDANVTPPIQSAAETIASVTPTDVNVTPPIQSAAETIASVTPTPSPPTPPMPSFPESISPDARIAARANSGGPTETTMPIPAIVPDRPSTPGERPAAIQQTPDIAIAGGAPPRIPPVSADPAMAPGENPPVPVPTGPVAAGPDQPGGQGFRSEAAATIPDLGTDGPVMPESVSAGEDSGIQRSIDLVEGGDRPGNPSPVLPIDAAQQRLTAPADAIPEPADSPAESSTDAALLPADTTNLPIDAPVQQVAAPADAIPEPADSPAESSTDAALLPADTTNLPIDAPVQQVAAPADAIPEPADSPVESSVDAALQRFEAATDETGSSFEAAVASDPSIVQRFSAPASSDSGEAPESTPISEPSQVQSWDKASAAPDLASSTGFTETIGIQRSPEDRGIEFSADSATVPPTEPAPLPFPDVETTDNAPDRTSSPSANAESGIQRLAGAESLPSPDQSPLMASADPTAVQPQADEGDRPAADGPVTLTGLETAGIQPDPETTFPPPDGTPAPVRPGIQRLAAEITPDRPDSGRSGDPADEPAGERAWSSTEPPLGDVPGIQRFAAVSANRPDAPAATAAESGDGSESGGSQPAAIQRLAASPPTLEDQTATMAAAAEVPTTTPETESVAIPSFTASPADLQDGSATVPESTASPGAGPAGIQRLAASPPTLEDQTATTTASGASEPGASQSFATSPAPTTLDSTESPAVPSEAEPAVIQSFSESPVVPQGQTVTAAESGGSESGGPEPGAIQPFAVSPAHLPGSPAPTTPDARESPVSIPGAKPEVIQPLAEIPATATEPPASSTTASEPGSTAIQHFAELPTEQQNDPATVTQSTVGRESMPGAEPAAIQALAADRSDRQAGSADTPAETGTASDSRDVPHSPVSEGAGIQRFTEVRTPAADQAEPRTPVETPRIQRVPASPVASGSLETAPSEPASGTDRTVAQLLAAGAPLPELPTVLQNLGHQHPLGEGTAQTKQSADSFSLQDGLEPMEGTPIGEAVGESWPQTSPELDAQGEPPAPGSLPIVQAKSVTPIPSLLPSQFSGAKFAGGLGGEIPDSWSSIEELLGASAAEAPGSPRGGESGSAPAPASLPVVQRYREDHQSESDFDLTIRAPDVQPIGDGGFPFELTPIQKADPMVGLAADANQPGDAQYSDIIKYKDALGNQSPTSIAAADATVTTVVSQAITEALSPEQRTEDVANLEFLAREIYGLLRQRLEVERERHGRLYRSDRLNR